MRTLKILAAAALLLLATAAVALGSDAVRDRQQDRDRTADCAANDAPCAAQGAATQSRDRDGDCTRDGDCERSRDRDRACDGSGDCDGSRDCPGAGSCDGDQTRTRAQDGDQDRERDCTGDQTQTRDGNDGDAAQAGPGYQCGDGAGQCGADGGGR